MITSPAPDGRVAIQPDLLRRVGVTLAALVAYRIASFIPIPGINLDALPQLGANGLERLSLMALGMIPWLSAAVLAEIVILFLPIRMTHRIARDGHVNPFDPLVLGGALAFAALQAYGVAVAMEAARGMVTEPDLHFRAGAIASMVTGTALAILLAHLVSRDGIGAGFWVLLAGTALPALAQEILQLIWMWSRGAVSEVTVLQFLAITAAIIAAIVVLVLTRRKQGRTTHDAVAWPIFVWAAVAPYFAVLAQLVFGAMFDDRKVYELIMPFRPLGAVIAALTIAAIFVRYGQRQGSLALMPVEAAALAAIVILTTGAPHWFGYGLPAAGPLVILTIVVTLVAQQAMAAIKIDTSARDDAANPQTEDP